MAFKIDESKLRSALPVPTSTAGEDLSIVGKLFAGFGLIIAAVLLLGWSVLRALS